MYGLFFVFLGYLLGRYEAVVNMSGLKIDCLNATNIAQKKATNKSANNNTDIKSFCLLIQCTLAVSRPRILGSSAALLPASHLVDSLAP
jgi:hypothetical protein